MIIEEYGMKKLFLVSLLVGLALVVAAAARPSALTSEHDTSKASQPGWLIKRAKAYSSAELKEKHKRLLLPLQPLPSVYRGRAFRWNVNEIFELTVNSDLTVYAVHYFSEPDVQLGSLGTLLMSNKGESIHVETNAYASPALGDTPIPALTVVKSASRDIVLFNAYEDSSIRQSLYSLSADRYMISFLVTQGNGEFVIQDIDQDGILEVSGYELKLNSRDECTDEDPLTKQEIEKIGQLLGVQHVHPHWGKGMSGIYQVYLLDGSGRFVAIRGAQWKRFYEHKAKALLTHLGEAIGRGDWDRTADAVLSYLGVLEGIGESESVTHLYSRLPNHIRAKINPTLLARYWAIKGYPGLLGIFKD